MTQTKPNPEIEIANLRLKILWLQKEIERIEEKLNSY